MLKRNSLTIFNVHSNTTALTANFSRVKGENRLAVYCIDDFGKVWYVLAKRPLLPCIPHRRGLFWLNSPDIMEFSLWKRFTTWSIPSFVVQRMRVLRSSWILSECNLSWKIGQNYILSEVYMIKNSASTFTSDVIFKKYKRQPFFTPPDLLTRFCKSKLVEHKNSAWLFILPPFLDKVM